MEGAKKRESALAVSPCASRKKHRSSEADCSSTDKNSCKVNHPLQAGRHTIGAGTMESSANTAETMEKSANKVASSEMCVYCFDSLMGHFFKKFEKTPPAFTNDSFPLFVTWQIGSARRLRGCIGTFSSLSLHRGIKEYALTSAMSDSRFSPVSKDEISRLCVSVSLLVDFEDALNYLDWTVGLHGIKIEITQGSSNRTATYLPEVALEAGWTKEETIESLLKKAGTKGQFTQALKDSIKLTRYRSEKVKMTFEEYASTKKSAREVLNGCYVPLSNGH